MALQKLDKCFTNYDTQLVFKKMKPWQSIEYTGYKQAKLLIYKHGFYWLQL